MNINTNYGISNRYSNLRLNEQQNMTNNTAPAFKMADKIVKRGLVSAALAAAYTGVVLNNSKAEEPQGLTLDKLKDYMKDRTNFKDVDKVKDIVYKHPNIVNRLLSIKNPDGSQYFNEYDILYNVLSPLADELLENHEKVFAVLDNPEELAGMRDEKYNNFHAGMLIWAIQHPLESTRKANPELFEPEKEITLNSVGQEMLNMDAENDFKLAGLKALHANPKLVDKLAAVKDNAGHQFLDSVSIAGFIANIATRLENKNKDTLNAIDKFINDPKQIGYTEGYMNRGFGFWRCFVD